MCCMLVANFPFFFCFLILIVLRGHKISMLIAMMSDNTYNNIWGSIIYAGSYSNIIFFHTTPFE